MPPIVLLQKGKDLTLSYKKIPTEMSKGQIDNTKTCLRENFAIIDQVDIYNAEEQDKRYRDVRIKDRYQ